MKGLFTIAAVLLLLSCSKKKNKVVLHLTGAFNRSFVLKRVSVGETSSKQIDSAIPRSVRDSFVYYLPVSEPAIYRIHFQYKPIEISFIADSSDIDIYYNYTTGEYHFVNSPASEEWRLFQQHQAALAGEERKLWTLSKDSAATQVDSLIRESYNRNFHFADTVTNPALFLLAYNVIDYGSDYRGLQAFIGNAARRFPHHKGVQELVSNTLDYVRIFNSPLKLGDTLPRLSMPDINGRNIEIGPSSGKYTLIDFWSTWCDDCRPFLEAKRAAWKRWGAGPFAIISVAIDAERDAWVSVTRHERNLWPQIIDEKMWAGPVARTLRFDSIPFNFLIDPNGRIVAKGIAADSLDKTLSSFLK